MTDENPTELETFQILEEAHKTLKMAMDPEYSKFMHSCITGGKSGAACKADWDDKHKTAKMSAEMEPAEPMKVASHVKLTVENAHSLKK